MSGFEPDARTRLQRSALDLFRRQGFERTTAAEIAAAAGVTERTFFRYFPDKREVLFDGEEILRTAMTDAVARAKAEMTPVEALFSAFRSIVPLLEANRGYSEPRNEVIAATPALREREFAKTAALADALAEALEARGAGKLHAALAARSGMAAFVHATLEWLADPSVGLGDRVEAARRGLRELFADIGPGADAGGGSGRGRADPPNAS